MAVFSARMPYPVRLGQLVYPDREYVLLRLHTDSGLVGSAFGYTRGAPIAKELEILLHDLLETDAFQWRRVREGLEGAYAPSRGNFVRALNLIDIAVWDVLARHASLPLYALLGGHRKRIPLMGVAGYFADVRSRQEVLQEVAEFAEQGFRYVKIMLDGREHVADAKFAQEAYDMLPHASLAVDYHSAWQDAGDAWAGCRLLDDLGLFFIEDPFLVHRTHLYSELAKKVRTPLASGEDAVYLDTFRALSPHLGYLRLDATVSTGVTDALAVIGMAKMLGRPVVPHVFAPVHAQLAGAFSSIPAVEWISTSVGADPWDQFMEDAPRIERGEMILGDEPGLGFTFAWDSVVKHATVEAIRP